MAFSYTLTTSDKSWGFQISVCHTETFWTQVTSLKIGTASQDSHSRHSLVVAAAVTVVQFIISVHASEVCAFWKILSQLKWVLEKQVFLTTWFNQLWGSDANDLEVGLYQVKTAT